jgi:hypothetical protein
VAHRLAALPGEQERGRAALMRCGSIRVIPVGHAALQRSEVAATEPTDLKRWA